MIKSKNGQRWRLVLSNFLKFSLEFDEFLGNIWFWENSMKNRKKKKYNEKVKNKFKLNKLFLYVF